MEKGCSEWEIEDEEGQGMEVGIVEFGFIVLLGKLEVGVCRLSLVIVRIAWIQVWEEFRDFQGGWRLF